MGAETLFISDLHLSLARPALTARFLTFLENRARWAERLYILGDLFDAYIGDDDNSALNATVKNALKRLTAHGTAVYFQHGNRDFLLGERFARETGVRLLDDYALVELYGSTVLLTHGDLLCTDDLPYQQARRRVRSAAWKAKALAKPLWLRRLYARWYRFKSGVDKAQKDQEIMDANPQTVDETLRRFAVTTLIHGHTHRPAVHRFVVDGQPALRIVLGEWHEDEARILYWPATGNWSLECLGASPALSLP